MPNMNRILVIDDNHAILDVVKVILEDHGYVVDVMSDGDGALQRVLNFQPSLIIIDVFLSGNDGRQLCRKLKSAEITKNIPIIMFSAQSKMEEVLSLCNANDFIAKPFDVGELLEKVRFHLEYSLQSSVGSHQSTANSTNG